jgi:hypothetical protein
LHSIKSKYRCDCSTRKGSSKMNQGIKLHYYYPLYSWKTSRLAALNCKTYAPFHFPFSSILARHTWQE